MQLFAIELLLWLGFALLLWALKDSLHQLESEMQSYQSSLRAPSGVSRRHIATPQNLIEPIGYYLGQPIHRYAVIDGRHYRFEYVCPDKMHLQLDDNQRWVAPGLVYQESPVPAAG